MDPTQLAVRIPALLVAITFHEFAHARVALAFGDDTAEEQGRVTLNPLAHLDPIGTIGMIVGSFGWGRPVPVNPSRFRHPRADFFVSAAGPASNLLIAAAGGLGLRLLPLGSAPSALLDFSVSFLAWLIFLNLSLAFFNLLPLFPLDGSHMAENLLPVDKAYAFKRFNESYGMPILFGLMAIGWMKPELSPLGFVLGPPIGYLLGILIPGPHY